MHTLLYLFYLVRIVNVSFICRVSASVCVVVFFVCLCLFVAAVMRSSLLTRSFTAMCAQSFQSEEPSLYFLLIPDDELRANMNWWCGFTSSHQF